MTHNQKFILHMCQRTAWEEAQKSGSYSADSLENEGFIHCSKPTQIERVANSFYPGVTGMVLLHIQTDTLSSEIRWEQTEGEDFPHIYGPINLDAVVKVEDFSLNQEGVFTYP